MMRAKREKRRGESEETKGRREMKGHREGGRGRYGEGYGGELMVKRKEEKQKGKVRRNELWGWVGGKKEKDREVGAEGRG